MSDHLIIASEDMKRVASECGLVAVVTKDDALAKLLDEAGRYLEWAAEQVVGAPVPAAPQPETGEERAWAGMVTLTLGPESRLSLHVHGHDVPWLLAHDGDLLPIHGLFDWLRSRPVVEAPALRAEDVLVRDAASAIRRSVATQTGAAVSGDDVITDLRAAGYEIAPVREAPALSEEHTAIPATAMLEIARYVGIPGEAMARLLGVLRIVMAGRALSASPGAERVEQKAHKLLERWTAVARPVTDPDVLPVIEAGDALARHIASEMGASAPHAAPPSEP